MPDTVTEVGNYSFANCGKLKKVKLSESILSLPSFVFCNCSSLSDINLSDNLTTIGNKSFENTALGNITIPKSVTTIGQSAFANARIGEVTFAKESKITKITNYAFTGSTLTKIEIPATINNIESYTFHNCRKLKMIIYQGEITKIEKSAFGYCESLIDFRFRRNSSIVSIGDDAFFNCTSLNLTLRLPANVSIGQGAFKDSLGNNLSGIKLEFVN